MLLNLVGGIPTPLKNMSSSVGMIIPNIWKVKTNVPKHQPRMYVDVGKHMTCSFFCSPVSSSTNQGMTIYSGEQFSNPKTPEPTSQSPKTQSTQQKPGAPTCNPKKQETPHKPFQTQRLLILAHYVPTYRDSSRLVVVDGRSLQLQGHASAKGVPKCLKYIMVIHDIMKTHANYLNSYQLISK